MKSEILHLADLADVFHGVANADIFNDDKLRTAKTYEEVTECRIIRAADVNSHRPWLNQEEITKVLVSKRTIQSERRRGLGQSCLLRPGDILMTTKGIPKVSPLVNYQIVQHGEVVAGPEVLVIRAKADAPPAALRDALKSAEAEAYLLRHTRGKAKNGSGVLSKAVACQLPLQAEAIARQPRFGEDTENLAYKSERLLNRLSALNHAIVDGARWRIDEQSPFTPIPRFDHDATKALTWVRRADEIEQDITRRSIQENKRINDEWIKNPADPMPDVSWRKQFRDEQRTLSVARDEWAAEGVVNFLRGLRRGVAADEDARILCRLLSGTESPSAAARAIIEDAERLGQLTHLVHRGDQRASTVGTCRTTRRILAECAEGHDSAMVMASETGHVAAEVIRREPGIRDICLIEKHAPYAKTGMALCEMIGAHTRFEWADEAYKIQRRKCPIALYEASGAETVPGMPDESALENSRRSFQWHALRDRLSPEGMLVAHLPTSRWELLMSVKDSVETVLQLPPLRLPAWNDGQNDKYAPCDQGLLVVLKPEVRQSSPVRLIDATRLNGARPAKGLSDDDIRRLASILKGRQTPENPIDFSEMPRETLFAQLRVWPGVSGLIRKQTDERELKRAYTLESLVEELKSVRDQLKRTQSTMFEKIGLQPDF